MRYSVSCGQYINCNFLIDVHMHRSPPHSFPGIRWMQREQVSTEHTLGFRYEWDGYYCWAFQIAQYDLFYVIYLFIISVATNLLLS